LPFALRPAFFNGLLTAFAGHDEINRPDEGRLIYTQAI